ncbi:MAG: hypothetical protein DRP47_09155, partial [Candidatus Zixiibacteriota bacterium]
MPAYKKDKPLFISLGISVMLFVAAQAVGSHLFDNGWSFDHWRHTPISYIIIWLLFFGGFTAFLIN